MALKDRLKPRDKEQQGAPRRRSRVGNGNGFSVPGYPGKGEPSHYNPEIIDMMYKYFSKDPWEMHYTDKGTAQMIPKDKMPTFGRFASIIGFSPRTFNDWRKKYPEFDAAYEDCKELQKSFILESGGLTLNGGFAMFMLKCNHGMIEPDATEKEDRVIQKVVVEVVGADKHSSDETPS